MPSLALAMTTAASSCLTSAAWVSTSWRAIESCCNNVRKRCSVTRAASIWASPCIRWPTACCSASSNWRGSMVASSSPLRTVWPSLNNTCCSTPETCGRTRTVACGTTVPSASSTTGMSMRSAVATPTVVAGPPRPPPGPPAPPPPPPAPPPPERAPPGRPPAAPPADGLVAAGSGAGGCVSSQASQPTPATRSNATSVPMIDARRLMRGRGGGSP